MSTSTDARPEPLDRRPSTKQSRSGNPARRAAASPRDLVVPAPAPIRKTRLVLGVLAILVATSAYTFGVMFLPWSVDSLFLLLMLSVPALVTMAFVPESRVNGRHRWPIAWALGFTSIYPLLVLILAQAWVLSRFWLIEYSPRSPIPNRRPKTAA